MTIEVDDSDAAHRHAVERGLDIVYPLTDEEWGVRRFFVLDPNGRVLSVMSHKANQEAAMRRQMAVAFMVSLGLFAGGGAGAQTTTTSSTTSSSTTSSIVNTTSTTSTTVVNPCTGQPCTLDPPVATLSGSAGDVRLQSFDYCWREIGGQLTRCVKGTPAPEADIPVALVVRRGETLTLRFAITMSPTEVLLQRGDVQGVAPVPLTAANPTTLVADLPVGTYFVTFRTKWNQGDVSYRLKIEVRAPATASDARVLALTG